MTMTDRDEIPAPKKGGSYVGVPAIFNLSNCCHLIQQAYPRSTCFLVGSSLVRPNWRDIDIRCVMPDEDMMRTFGHTDSITTMRSPILALLSLSISAWLKQQTGLPVDFQFQSQSRADFETDKPRLILGVWSTSAKPPISPLID